MTAISATANRTLMTQARESLRGKWGLAVVTVLVYYIVSALPNAIPMAGFVVSLLIGGALSLGLAIFALALARGQEARIAMVFDGFRNFGVALGAYLLMMIFVILWTLLLVIPGIIAFLSYSQTYYLIAQNEQLGPLEAITRSKEMMRGNRWKLFCLSCRFIGWALLGVLTFGIGLLWVVPYMTVAFAKFHDDLVETGATGEAAAPVGAVPPPAEPPAEAPAEQDPAASDTTDDGGE